MLIMMQERFGRCLKKVDPNAWLGFVITNTFHTESRWLVRDWLESNSCAHNAHRKGVYLH